MPSPAFPIPQGTLDMLILQILSLEPAHAYGIAQRLEQISRSVLRLLRTTHVFEPAPAEIA
jgi:PadR family transcriptional regulator, regulatory protein PadR